MTKQPLHVLFSGSAAGSVREALAKVGRQDRVIALHDSFEFGPINPPDPIARAEWVREVLGVDGWDEVAEQTRAVTAECLADQTRLIAWISRRDAHNYAGFLEWLSRLGDLPCDVVDVTDLTLSGRLRDGKHVPSSLIVSPATLNPDQIIEAGLLDRALPLTPLARDQYQMLWRKLRAENAPLRIVGADGLVSAPITHFDSLVMSLATTDWRKMARVLGEALIESWEGDLFPVGEMVLAARIRALAEEDHLEWRGDLSEMRNCEIRLPGAGSQPS